MNKKVIKSMFQNICSKDEMRPLMGGVHFEKERCYASDGHVLVIFKEGSEKLDGKTISVDGQEIQGRYPNVDSVIPTKENQGEAYRFDFIQLKNACAYHMKQLSYSEHDKVVINEAGLNIRTLYRLLSTITLIGDPKNIQFHIKNKDMAVMVTGDNFKGLIMPSLYREDEVDAEREFGDTKTLSYENFINNYVFNAWKKNQPKDEMSWCS